MPRKLNASAAVRDVRTCCTGYIVSSILVIAMHEEPSGNATCISICCVHHIGGPLALEIIRDAVVPHGGNCAGMKITDRHGAKLATIEKQEAYYRIRDLP